MFLFNDLGVGYFLYRDQACSGWITSVAPTLEVHVNTPLNHRGMNSQPIGADDIVDFTFGARFGIGARSDLGAAASIPVTGPKPFDVEALVQFNYRF